jgi:hypothetical protein
MGGASQSWNDRPRPGGAAQNAKDLNTTGISNQPLIFGQGVTGPNSKRPHATSGATQPWQSDKPAHDPNDPANTPEAQQKRAERQRKNEKKERLKDESPIPKVKSQVPEDKPQIPKDIHGNPMQGRALKRYIKQANFNAKNGK